MPEHTEKSGGLLSLVQGLLQERMPRGIGWPHTLGSALLALIVVQVVTGILLALYYSPNAQAAYDSVQYIEQRVLFGSVIRGLHYFAASGMVVLVFLHMMRTFFYGAYKRPRHWTWVFGVVLLLVVLGFAFTGYLLPWDMKAYFATKVGLNVGGLVPFIGSHLVKILQGGADMSTITLSRFFTLHVVVLPLVLVLIVGAHLFYIRLHGPTPPGLKEGDSVEFPNRFYPLQLFRDSLVVFLVVGLLLILAVKFGAALEVKADPNDTSYVPRPDWYFYSLFQLLKIFQGKLEIIGAVILPGAFFTLLILLPFFDRNPERRLARRPLATSVGSSVVVALVFLTAWGAYEGQQAKEAMVTATEESTAGDLNELPEADPLHGELLFTGLKCGKCHDAVAGGLNIPPGLEFAGNKYRQSWLVEYLQNPFRIRWSDKNKRPVIRMPDFKLSFEEANDLAAFLTTHRTDSKFPEPEFDWSEADTEMVASGKGLVFEYGCFGCHKIDEEGQNVGPELSHVGSKLLESYMFHLIKAPDKIVPGTSMKDFHLEDEDVEDIVAYLRELR
ncbi:MAG: cytochrome b N-terminal domain-containing protein [bacterium]